MDFDRFAHGYQREEAQVYCACSHCGDHIYIGDDIYEINRDTIHYDCLHDYFEDCKKEAQEIGVEV